MTQKEVIMPPAGTDIKADVYLTYTLRHVLSGDETYEERDDNIVEKTIGPVLRTVNLIPAREGAPYNFGIHLTSGEYRGIPLSGIPVSIQQAGVSEPVALCFASEPEATNFLTYMRAENERHPEMLGDARLGVVLPPTGLVALTSAELATAQVQLRCP